MVEAAQRRAIPTPLPSLPPTKFHKNKPLGPSQFVIRMCNSNISQCIYFSERKLLVFFYLEGPDGVVGGVLQSQSVVLLKPESYIYSMSFVLLEFTLDPDKGIAYKGS